MYFRGGVQDLKVKSLERVTDSSLPAELLELKSFHEVPQVCKLCISLLKIKNITCVKSVSVIQFGCVL